MAQAAEQHDRADLAVKVGMAVRTRRRQLRLRQSELADLAGVSERFVHAVERGKRTVQLDKLIDVLDAVGLHLQIRRGGAPWITLESDDAVLAGR